MKFIHCADLHLNSKIDTLPKEKTKIRREEILRTFEKTCNYALSNDVKAVIIAGDMFDTNKIPTSVRERVLYAISSCKDVDFLYLSGNHDDGFISNGDNLPQNLKVFGNEWTSFRYGKTVITGIRFDGVNNKFIYDKLRLNKEDVNIVVLHGQIVGYKSGEDAETISLPLLKDKNIDYLALGHIHFYDEKALDNRGKYAYSGCLDGRGFDELGEKGFVLLDVDNGVKTQFVKFSSRCFYEYTYDVSLDKSIYETREKIKSYLISNYAKESLIKVILKGSHKADYFIDKDNLASFLGEDFFFVKVYDKTELQIAEEDYKYDKTVKGEFIRAVFASELSKEEKDAIIVKGLNALNGEEL